MPEDFVPDFTKPLVPNEPEKPGVVTPAEEKPLEQKVAEKVASEEPSADENREKEMASCLEEATRILKEHDGKESDISVESNYWKLMNRYRALKNK